MIKFFAKLKERIIALPMWVWLTFAAIVGGFEIFRRSYFGGGCLLLDIFDFPCPSCGMSRALICALLLKFDLAFSYNPAFWVVPLCGICLIMAFADKKHPHLWVTLFFIFVSIVILVWLILRVIMGVPIPV